MEEDLDALRGIGFLGRGERGGGGCPLAYDERARESNDKGRPRARLSRVAVADSGLKPQISDQYDGDASSSG